MTEERLQEVLKKHGEWIMTRFTSEPKGERADLRGAYLQGAYLQGAYLRGAYLQRAYLHCPICCPEKGSFTGFKKASGHIVELRITETAKRCSATGRKCRCSEAVVVSITKMDGSEANVEEVRSNHDNRFIYRIGETVKVDNFCEDRWTECAAGIHFFITREEAVQY